MYGWHSFDPSYIEVCAQSVADPSAFASFRGQPSYRSVVETVTFRQGLAYLGGILLKFPHLVPQVSKAAKEDGIGSPEQCRYGPWKVSPTTLRYLYTLGDLELEFGPLEGMSIAEVGVGYGGQAKAIAQRFNVGYSLIDLPAVEMLAHRFLWEFGVPHSFGNPGRCDLFISNYARAELEKAEQDRYWGLIGNSERGYITYDWEGEPTGQSPYPGKEFVEKLSKVHPVRVRREWPRTAPHNFVVVWGPHGSGTSG